MERDIKLIEKSERKLAQNISLGLLKYKDFEHAQELEIIPASIDDTSGFMIEITGGDTRTTQLDFTHHIVNECDNIYVYGLYHSENDWSEPCTVVNRSGILVNRFGWYFTCDDMDFDDVDDPNSYIHLNKENSKFRFRETEKLIEYLNKRVVVK